MNGDAAGKGWERYLASVVGSVLGTVLGAVAAFAVLISSFNGGLPDLSTRDVVFKMILPGLALTVVGCYTALRVVGVAHAALTSWVVAASDVVALALALALSQWLIVLPAFGLLSPLTASAVVGLLDRDAP